MTFLVPRGLERKGGKHIGISPGLNLCPPFSNQLESRPPCICDGGKQLRAWGD